MYHAHHRGRVAEALEHVAPGLSGPPVVVIGSHSELGISPLDRRVDHVAGDQCIVSGPADQHGVMVDRIWPGVGLNWINSLSAKSLFTICARFASTIGSTESVIRQAKTPRGVLLLAEPPDNEV